MDRAIRHIVIILAGLVLVGLFSLTSCKDSKPIRLKKNTLQLTVVHPPHLIPFMRQISALFNESPTATLAEGTRIELNLVPENSISASGRIGSGRVKVHGWLASSTSLINYTNVNLKNLGPRQVNCTQLFATPLVVATPKRNVAKIGGENGEISWKKLFPIDEVTDPKRSFPLYNHSSPMVTETGLATLVQLGYMATGFPSTLGESDIKLPAVLHKLETFEKLVTNYSFSERSLLAQIALARNDKVHYTISSEQEVAQFNHSRVKQGLEPLQALYPKEGATWIDFNMCSSEADWLSPAHRRGMEQFSGFLTTLPPQQIAVSFGFRPSSGKVPLTPPLTADYGVDISKGTTALLPASGEVVKLLLEKWPELLKPSAISFVIDTSGSMEGPSLRLGKTHFRNSLAGTTWRDKKALLSFASTVEIKSDFTTEAGEIIPILDKLQAQGGSAVYDAILKAATLLQRDNLSGYRRTIVIFTDGGDKNSDTPLKRLTELSKDLFNRNSISLIIIAVGHDSNFDDLISIAEASNGLFIHAGYDELNEVFARIRAII